MVRIGRDDAADLVRLEIFLRVVLQMQHDLGAARHARAPASSLAGAISKPAPPVERHTQASADPARRLVTSMRSATMKAE